MRSYQPRGIDVLDELTTKFRYLNLGILRGRGNSRGSYMQNLRVRQKCLFRACSDPIMITAIIRLTILRVRGRKFVPPHAYGGRIAYPDGAMPRGGRARGRRSTL
eukprot:SAG31_NODE_1222_length_9294_cov_4.099184_9_plen_105_part_00